MGNCLACTATPPAPAVSAVDPGRVPDNATTPVTIRGSGFYASVRADFDSPSQSQVNAVFAAYITLGGTSTNLLSVALVDSKDLSAQVPSGLAAGAYDLTVIDPFGRQATLGAALTVFSTICQTDGAPCDDGNPCTHSDVCRGGRCEGNPYTCTPTFCQSSSTCDGQGGCTTANKTDGTPCDDGNACTYADVCTGGVCSGTAYVCAAVPLSCETSTCVGDGGCVIGSQPDGTACDDGDPCTYGDRCATGTCSGAAYACPAASACQAAACVGDGGCSGANRADGTPCNDGNACDKGAVCTAGACGGAPWTGMCSTNTYPFACVEVFPTAGLVSTTFRFDASCSSDFEDPTSALQVRFDFDGDGVFDTPFSAAKTASFSYAVAGLYQVTVEVRDTGGLNAFASRYVSVALPAQDVVVNTAVDENDPGATPSNPGGTGLSLREAVNYVNGLTAPRRIRFLGPMTIATNGQRLPDMTSAGSSIVGQPGVTIDFGMPSNPVIPCFRLAGNAQRLLDVVVKNCRGPVLELAGAASQIAEATILSGGNEGVNITGGSSLAGPRNDISGTTVGCRMSATGTLVDGNRLHGNGVGIEVNAGGGAVVQRNLVYGGSTLGIQVDASEPSPAIRFNTVDRNAGDGLNAISSDTNVDLRDNLFTDNGGVGVSGMPGVFVLRDPNGLFANTSGAFSNGAPGASSVQANPLYVNGAAADFRLMPASPMNNAGVDLGLGNNYDGSTPDLGAEQTPY